MSHIEAVSTTLRLPSATGGRQDAKVLLTTPEAVHLRPAEVQIESGAVVRTTPSYLDELIKELVEVRHVGHVVFIGLLPSFEDWARASVARRRLPESAVTFRSTSG